MRDAVARLVGEHDFRNFCKVDPPKQLSKHVRTVNSATIDRVEGEGDDLWVLNLRGGAFVRLYLSLPCFSRRTPCPQRVRHDADGGLLVLEQLYNQVRHIVAILFLVGARLEPPSIVDALLWTSDRTPDTLASVERAQRPEPGATPTMPGEVMDRKPGYQMADDLPLVLWQCGFNSSEFSWRTDNAPRAGDLPEAVVQRWTDHNGRDRPVVREGESSAR